MSPLDQARAALALCDAPPSAPETRHYLRCSEGHGLADSSDPVPPWNEETKQDFECTICPVDDWDRSEYSIVTRTWVHHPPTTVDAEHLRADLAEGDRLAAERDEAANVIAASERWITLRDEARRLDALARPGAVMDDDDLLDAVVRVLRRAAGGAS